MKLLEDKNNNEYEIPEIGFFEGTEKLLEIWFHSESKGSNHLNGKKHCNDKKDDLRNIPRKRLDELLKVVDAEIVSVDKNEFIDSYVLSESSMFISSNRFIIKTCGIIKLLFSIQPLFELVKEYTCMKLANFFYSRKVYLKPEEQIGIHQTFNTEVNYLEELVPGGSPYIIGSKEGEQWYLFTSDNNSNSPDNDDATLEILMSNMDNKAMVEFTKMKNDSSVEVIKNSGIEKIVPGSMNDGCLFNPIGFSMNGLNKNGYYTIHVTPQASCSYVSFETNIKRKDYSQIVNQVVDIFKPNKFIITLFSTKGSMCGDASKALDRVTLNQYCCDDKSSHQLKNYSLAYRYYCKQS